MDLRFEDIVRLMNTVARAGVSQDLPEDGRELYRRKYGCPSEEVLEGLLEGTLQATLRLPVWWHVKQCALCNADLAVLRKMWFAMSEVVFENCALGAEDGLQESPELFESSFEKQLGTLGPIATAPVGEPKPDSDGRLGWCETRACRQSESVAWADYEDIESAPSRLRSFRFRSLAEYSAG